MREKALLFGPTKSLAGVVTEPGPGAENGVGPGVVILNAGIVHHVGPNRIHVKLARRLAGMGILAMRFDCSGIGDSGPRADGKPFGESVVEETRQCLDYLEASRGVRGFVLFGMCSGADNALRAGSGDERVRGVVLVEGHALATPAYLLRLYRRSLSSPRSWFRLLAGKSELWTAFRGRKKKAGRDGARVRARSLTPSRREILASLSTLSSRGARVLLIYSEGSPSHLYYETRIRRRIAPLLERGIVTAHLIPGADHVFTHAATQRDLLDSVIDWSRGLESPASAAPSGRLEPATGPLHP